MADPILVLAVGIDAYPDLGAAGPFGANPELKFAGADARSLAEYCREVWPGCTTQLLLGQEATLSAIQNAVSSLAACGPVDLFICFLAGHGFQVLGSTRYLTADARLPAPAGLDREALDKILEAVKARRTLLFLDCCFAEQVVAGSRFFSGLTWSEARLYICSSRGDQRTWEEEACGHGVFTALLLDALRGAAPGFTIGKLLDVDSQLFPFLCQQVPLYVHSHKAGAAQEPVKGGASRAPVQLPIGHSSGKIGHRTVLASVLAWVRRVALTVAVSLLALFGFVHLFCFHVVRSGEGRVVLRHGLRETAALSTLLGQLRLDTGFFASEFSPEAAQLSGLYNAALVGFWPQRTASGYRNWIDRVKPLMLESRRSSIDLDLDFRLPAGFLDRSPTLVQSWSAELIARALILDTSNPQPRKDWLQQTFQPYAEAASSLLPDDPNNLNFELLNLAEEQLRGYLNALSILALTDSDRAFAGWKSMLVIVRYWSRQQPDKQASERLIDTLGETLRSIASVRVAKGNRALSLAEIDELNKLFKQGFGAWVTCPLATTGEAFDLDWARTALLDQFPAIDQSSSQIYLEPGQSLALKALAELARPPGRVGQVVASLVETLAARGYFPERYPDLTAFYLILARLAALPQATVDRLFRATDSGEASDPFRVDALDILAANARFFPPEKKGQLMTVLARARVTENNNPLIFATIYGRLALAGLATEEMLSQLERIHQPSPASSSSPEPDAPQEVATVISPEPEKALVAIGRYAQQLPIGTKRLESLTAWAADHPDQANRRDILLGILRERTRLAAPEPGAGEIRAALAFHPLSANRRRLEADLAIEALLELSPVQRDAIWTALQKLHNTEIEPEIRIELAHLLFQMRRLGPIYQAGLGSVN